MAEVCHACQQAILPRDRSAMAMNHVYHWNHFVCARCNVPFDGKPFYVRNGEPYCSADYDDLFLPKCAKCGQPILGDQMDAGGRHFHVDCFSCDRCSSRLEDDYIELGDNKRLCVPCAASRHACSNCGGMITSSYLVVNGRDYHTNCLQCEDCMARLSDGKYYTMEDKILCRIHYLYRANLFCNYCQEPVGQGFVQVDNVVFHPEHFICIECHVSLSGTIGDNFTVGKRDDGAYICMDCSRAGKARSKSGEGSNLPPFVLPPYSSGSSSSNSNSSSSRMGSGYDSLRYGGKDRIGSQRERRKPEGMKSSLSDLFVPAPASLSQPTTITATTTTTATTTSSTTTTSGNIGNLSNSNNTSSSRPVPPSPRFAGGGFSDPPYEAPAPVSNAPPSPKKELKPPLLPPQNMMPKRKAQSSPVIATASHESSSDSTPTTPESAASSPSPQPPQYLAPLENKSLETMDAELAAELQELDGLLDALNNDDEDKFLQSVIEANAEKKSKVAAKTAEPTPSPDDEAGAAGAGPLRTMRPSLSSTFFFNIPDVEPRDTVVESDEYEPKVRDNVSVVDLSVSQVEIASALKLHLWEVTDHLVELSADELKQAHANRQEVLASTPSTPLSPSKPFFADPVAVAGGAAATAAGAGAGAAKKKGSRNRAVRSLSIAPRPSWMKGVSTKQANVMSSLQDMLEETAGAAAATAAAVPSSSEPPSPKPANRFRERASTMETGTIRLSLRAIGDDAEYKTFLVTTQETSKTLIQRALQRVNAADKTPERYILIWHYMGRDRAIGYNEHPLEWKLELARENKELLLEDPIFALMDKVVTRNAKLMLSSVVTETVEQRTIIVQGDIPDLLQLLSEGEVVQADFVEIFLLTYRYFVSDEEVLNHLIQSHSDHCHDRSVNRREHSTDTVKIWNSVNETHIVDVWRSWFELVITDFTRSPQLTSILNHYLLTDIFESSPARQLLRTSIRDCLKQCEDKLSKRHRTPLLIAGPEKRSSTMNLKDSKSRSGAGLKRSPSISSLSRKTPHKLFDLSVNEATEALTVIEMDIFRRIEMDELLTQGWSSRNDRNKLAPNIVAHINWFNKMTLWVASQVCLTVNSRIRVMIIERYIALANAARRLRNFSTAFQIILGLNMAPVSRLQKTWKRVNKKYVVIFNQLVHLVSPHKNHKNYRDVVAEIGLQPCMPFLGMYLKDILFAMEGSPTILQNDSVNFGKMNTVGRIILQIRRFQSNTFHVPEVQRHIDWFRENVVAVTEQQLIEASNHLAQTEE